MADKVCPKCDKSFETERGMKSHYGQVHDGSISGREKECEVCGEIFRKLPCRIERDDHHTCSDECRVELVAELVSGKDNYQWIEDRYSSCNYCYNFYDMVSVGGVGKYCSIECRNLDYKNRLTGPDNPNWNGGHIKYYGKAWIEFRQKVRERDGNICQNCGKSSQELDKTPSVHHIVPVRKFDDIENAHTMENCVQLCQSCHMKFEYNLTESEQRERLKL